MDYGVYIIIGITIALVVPYFIRLAKRRTWGQALGESQRRGQFMVKLPADQIRAKLLELAKSKGYTIEETSELQIVLADQPTATSWGFFYPITLSTKPDGTTILTIGIKSRLMQFGPVVSKHHKRLMEQITSAFS